MAEISDISKLIWSLVEEREKLTLQLKHALADAERQRDDADHWKARFRELAEANATEATGVSSTSEPSEMNGFGT